MRHISNNTNHLYEFGEFCFDAEKRVLRRGSEILLLPPKATDVLAVLIEEHGELVERERLLRAVWQDTFVEEGNLNNAVSALRKVLGDSEIIQTVPRRGYRFTAEVRKSDPHAPDLVIERRSISRTLIEEFESSDVLEPGRPLLPVDTGKRRLARYASAAIALIAGIGCVWLFMSGSRGGLANSGSPIKSIALLPLRSFSQQNDAELRMRITDALITKLGAFKQLEVRPTSSVMKFVNEDQNITEVGRALEVDAVLDGHLQEENGLLRVTLQLISVSNGNQLWSEQFDGRPGEILALQDVISRRLGQDLSLVEDKEFSRSQPANNDSYEAYLKGRFLWNQRHRDSFFKALDYFQQSVRADPNFALGYTGISDCYHLLQQRNEMPTIEAFAKAESAAVRALELDPNLPEAHVSMGSVNFVRYSRWTAAEVSYRRAIELNPNHAESYARLGMLYNAWGRFDESYEMLKKAESLDPTSINNAIYLGANFYFSKQYDRAETHFKGILEFAPSTERAHFFLYRIYEITGRYDLAVEHALKEREIWNEASVSALRNAYEQGGIKGFWLKQIDVMKEEIKERPVTENHIAARYVLLGDYDSATRYVELNIKNFGTMMNYGRVDPIFDPLRSRQDFQALLDKAQPAI